MRAALGALGAGCASPASASDRLAGKVASLEKVPLPPPEVPAGALMRIESLRDESCGVPADGRRLSTDVAGLIEDSDPVALRILPRCAWERIDARHRPLARGD